MTLRVFEAFAGYGSQSLALRNLGLDYQVVGISEIDKYAIQAYEALHGPVHNFGDISKIQPSQLPNFDLMTYSFPCQDLSVAGQQKGLKKGTRSGLLYECERIIEHKKPKFLLLENVKNLVSKRFRPQFDEWLTYLESLGYTNYWKVLNAKDYGIPQNRERVFVVSILGEHQTYEFPKGQDYIPKLKEFLEREVDESFYLSPMVQERFRPKTPGDGAIKVVGTTAPLSRTIGQHDLVYSGEGVIGCLMAVDYKQPKQFYEEICTKAIGHSSYSHNLEKTPQPNTVYPQDGLSSCLSISDFKSPTKLLCPTTQNKYSPKIYGSSTQYRIRKITPRECFRLMGLSESDIDKIQATGLSNTQQYKLAGNSIVVNVLEGLFKRLFESTSYM